MISCAEQAAQLCVEQQTAVLGTTVVTQDGRSLEFFSKHSLLDCLVDIAWIFSFVKLDFEYN